MGRMGSGLQNGVVARGLKAGMGAMQGIAGGDPLSALSSLKGVMQPGGGGGGGEGPEMPSSPTQPQQSLLRTTQYEEQPPIGAYGRTPEEVMQNYDNRWKKYYL